MNKYRRKPVELDAQQWFPGTPVEGVEQVQIGQTGMQCGVIQGLEGPAIVMPGDWIVTGLRGERYAVKPHIFADLYELCAPDAGGGHG